MSIDLWHGYQDALQTTLNKWGNRRTGWGKRYRNRVSINDTHELLIDGLSLETVEMQQATYQAMPWWKKTTHWFSYLGIRSRAALLPYARAQRTLTALIEQATTFYNDVALYEKMVDNEPKQLKYQELLSESDALREKLDGLRNALTPYHPPVSLLSYEDYRIMQKSLFSLSSNNEVTIYKKYDDVINTFENECLEIEKGLELFEKMERISSKAMYEVRKWHLNFHLINALDDICKLRKSDVTPSFLAKATESETTLLNRALNCLSNLNEKMLPSSQRKKYKKLKTLTQIKNYFVQRFLCISSQKAHSALANSYYFMPNKNQLGLRVDDFSLEGTQENLKQCQRIISDEYSVFGPDASLIKTNENETKNFRRLSKIQQIEKEYKVNLSAIVTAFTQKIKQCVQVEKLKKDYLEYQNKLLKKTLNSKLQPDFYKHLSPEQNQLLTTIETRCQQQAFTKLTQSFNDRSQQFEQALKEKEALFLETFQTELDLYKTQLADGVNQFKIAITQRFDQKFITALYERIHSVISHIKLSSYLLTERQAKLSLQEKTWLFKATKQAQQEALLALTKVKNEQEEAIEKQREKARSFYMRPYSFAYAEHPVDKAHLNLYVDDDDNTLWFSTLETDGSIVRRQIVVTNPNDPDSADGLTPQQFENLSTYLEEGSIEHEAGLKKDTVIAIHSLIAREGYNIFSNNDIFYMLAFFYTNEFTEVYVPLYRRIIEWQYAIALQCQNYITSLQSWLMQQDEYVNILVMFSNRKKLENADNEEHCQQLIHNLATAWYKHDKQNPVISNEAWQGKYLFTEYDFNRPLLPNQIQVIYIDSTTLQCKLLSYYGELIYRTINIETDLKSVNCPDNILRDLKIKLARVNAKNPTEGFNIADIQPVASYILQILRARHELMGNIQEEYRHFLLQTNTDKRENKEARENSKTFKTSDMLKAGLTELRSLYLDVDEDGSSLYAQHCYSYLKTLINKRAQTEEEVFQFAPQLNLYENINNNVIVDHFPALKPIEGNELVLKYQEKISFQAPDKTEKMFDFMKARILETHVDNIIMTGIMSLLLNLPLNKAYLLVCDIGAVCRTLKPLFIDSKSSNNIMNKIQSVTKSVQETRETVKQQKQTIKELKAQLAAAQEKNKPENTNNQTDLPSYDKAWSPAMFNQSVPNEKENGEEKSSNNNSQSPSTWQDYLK